MSFHEVLDDDARDRAALYAMDSMTGNEAAEYERHLAGCAACRREADSLREALAGIAGLAGAVTPPQQLKDRLLARIQGERPSIHLAPPAQSAPGVQVWKGWAGDATAPGLTLLAKKDERWEKTAAEGVEVRRLFVDAANDRATMLVRMQPGAAYPTHRHSGLEECYVIEGDLWVGDYRMHAGDYQRASGGSIHGIQSTEGGCLLFIVSSLHDELLDVRP